jgi:ubiquitin carboxyl-terminal hydrolase 10
MCFANAVLQLLVYCPPFWKLFREVGRLTGPRERGERIGGNATLLVDATVRFLEEFVHEEKKPPTQQPQQQAGNVKPKEEEDEKKEDDGVDSFIPTYIYNAMKEKKRFDNMRVGSRARVAPFVTDLCLLNVFRAATRKTRRSFLAFTSTHWRKSCLHYLLLSLRPNRPLLRPR